MSGYLNPGVCDLFDFWALYLGLFIARFLFSPLGLHRQRNNVENESSKHQGTRYKQISNSNNQNPKLLIVNMFGYLNLGVCDLFDFWALYLGLFFARLLFSPLGLHGVAIERSKHQDTRYKQISNSNNQIPKPLIVNMFVI